MSWNEHAGTDASFIPLSFSELVSKAVHLYGPPVSNATQFNTQFQLFPCMNFICSGNIMKLWFVALNESAHQQNIIQLPIFHLLRKYHGPEYCSDTDPPGSNCEYYQWLRVNQSIQYPHLVYINGGFGVYEIKFSTNNSFEIGDILGVHYPSYNAPMVLYQREGAYSNTLGEITIHSYGSMIQILYPRLDPVLPYIAIETG